MPSVALCAARRESECRGVEGSWKTVGDPLLAADLGVDLKRKGPCYGVIRKEYDRLLNKKH